MYCKTVGCYNDPILGGKFCRQCSGTVKVSVEFCMWIQDTDVFGTFVDHLNKGLDLKKLDINKPLTKKAGA